IGKEMNIFMFNNDSGQGFPIWLEDGMRVKNTIQKYVRETEARYGFEEVSTPAFGSKKLYETSGHWEHYKDDMFPIIEVENEELIMRPMTCPHHILIYMNKRRSYRELPIRMSEQARLYRKEKSGALTGLERVRSMELTEGHIFARQDQVLEEFKNSYKLIQEALEKFNIEIDYVSLSLRDKNDKEKYFDDDKMWEKAESDLRQVMKELNIKHEEKIGEAAFYGPKIDIQVKTALGHEITMSTLQLDFLLPKRFDITYIDKDETKSTPVLIHRGLIGTYERFISILLEQTKGNLPFWIAPRQATIIPVSIDSHIDYSDKVFKELKEQGLYVHLDDRNERVGRKIRDAQTSKTKYQIVIGDDEVKNKTITVRAYGSEKQETMTIKAFIEMSKK
ncbi:MAG: threonine--tRNA ligase, partial [Mycoplasmataceae bacterium]|nr:threonine--tRNA ligase [Mycoplasmataceae bacterium]